MIALRLLVALGCLCCIAVTCEPMKSDMEHLRGNADVVFAHAEQNSNGTWTFHVTVAHPDTGWEDYADGWDIVLPDGTILKKNASDPFTRLLLHPHETEQPFTRSQSGLVIPEGITMLTVRAHDLVDGYGGQEVSIDLTTGDGENYTVVHLTE